MLDPEFGVIKFFNSNLGKNYGFIIPDKRRADGKEYFFHRNNACQLSEEFPGEVGMVLETWVDREPHKGDRVIFYGANHAKGPVAFQWNYEQEWQRSQNLINSRPWPECILCRVIQNDKVTHQNSVLWEGHYPLLIEILIKGEVDFLQKKEDWYNYIWCEELRVGGWKRLWNPLDPSLPPLPTQVFMTQNERILLSHL